MDNINSNNNNNNNNNVSEIKSQLSLLNQQLLSKLLLSTSSTTTVNQDDQNQYEMKPIELITIISKLEQHCDQLMKSEVIFQSQSNQQQNHINQQQNHINQQQLELKQQQIDFEQEMKQQRFDLQCEQREFELKKREFDSQQLIYYHQQQSTTQSSSTTQPTNSSTNQLMNQSLSNSQSQQSILQPLTTEQSSSTILIQPQQQQQFRSLDDDQTTLYTHEILEHVLQDYQAMKHLIDQSTTTQQLFQQHYATLNQKLNEVQQIEQQSISKLNRFNQFQLQFNQLQPTIQSLLDKSATTVVEVDKIDQRLIVIEGHRRQQIQLMLEVNGLIYKSGGHFCFTFDNLPNIRMSCCGDWGDTTLNDALYYHLIGRYLNADLQQHRSTIENSKLFISSQSLLNGEWIQIQGDGAQIDIKTTKIRALVKPGDNIHLQSNLPCSKSCKNCHGGSASPQTKLFLIKFKWE